MHSQDFLLCVCVCVRVRVCVRVCSSSFFVCLFVHVLASPNIVIDDGNMFINVPEDKQIFFQYGHDVVSVKSLRDELSEHLRRTAIHWHCHIPCHPPAFSTPNSTFTANTHSALKCVSLASHLRVQPARWKPLRAIKWRQLIRSRPLPMPSSRFCEPLSLMKRTRPCRTQRFARVCVCVCM